MAEEKDRYLKNLYGSAEIAVGEEGEPSTAPAGMPAYLKVEFEETKEAEEWFGIEQDLGLVVTAAGKAAEIVERETSPSESRSGTGEADIVQHSLWTTALIAYARCFGTGVRARLDKGIFGDQEDMIRMHDYYKNIRDKHLAHSVNPFEVTATGIAVLYRSGLLMSQRLYSFYPPGVTSKSFEEGGLFPVGHKLPGERLLQ
jgi:hypothetical protein